jgi:hypothetical protein
VVKLEEGALSTPLSSGSDEGALSTVALPCRTLDLSRDVARRRSALVKFIRLGTDRAARLQLSHHGELGLLDPLEEQGEGALEDRAGISVGNLPAKERLHASELFVGLMADGELDAVPLRRRGLHDRAGRGTLRRGRQSRHRSLLE